MSEEITIKVKFERQTQPKQYEIARAGIELEMTYPGTFTPEQIANDGQSLYQVAKSLVFNELGVPFEQDSATGILMETFPGSTVMAIVPKSEPDHPVNKPRAVRAVPQAPESPAGDDADDYYQDEPEPVTTPSRPARRAARPAPAPAPAGLSTDDYWEDLEKNPGDWWDNRETKNNPKGPDFTSSKFKQDNGYRVALWLNSAPDWFNVPAGPFRPSSSR